MQNPNDPHFQQWQQQQPPPQYAPPPLAYYPQPQQQIADNEATTIFILGILGLVACAFLAPIAWIKGNNYRAVCRVSGTPPNGMATAGWALGIAGTVILGLSVLAFVGAFVLGAVSN
jgi:hypothetical protein